MKLGPKCIYDYRNFTQKSGVSRNFRQSIEVHNLFLTFDGTESFKWLTS